MSSGTCRQFVDNLNARVLTAPAAVEDAAVDGSAAETAGGSPPPPARAAGTQGALDLGATALVPVLQRLGPALALVLLVALVLARRARSTS